MRKKSLSFVVLALMAAGCEDGPNQIYKPSPAGADGRWNDGQSPPTADDGSKDFKPIGGGTNKQEICTADEKHARWSDMVKKEIKPPSIGGGLDLAGGLGPDGNETWKGLTVEQAEQVNCQSAYAYTDGGVAVNYWGDNGEVQITYRTSTRQILTVSLNKGYEGHLLATGRDGAKYDITISNEIKKNGAPFQIHWDDRTQLSADVNEIYDALLATYTSLPKEDDCTTGHCVVGDFGDQGAYMWFTTLGLTIEVPSTTAAQPIPSQPNVISQDLTKLLPFSFADTLLKLDAAGEGPVAVDKNVLGTGKTCRMRMGMNYGELVDSCISVLSDQKKNQVEMAKLLGGLSHGDERFHFDVYGVDVNFTDTNLAPFDVIRDNDKPDPGDLATTFRADQQMLGRIANDYPNNDPTVGDPDFHGLGMVTLEWATLVQEWFQRNTFADATGDHQEKWIGLGDPRCLAPNDPTQTQGCTGLEGIVTTSPVAAVGTASTPAPGPGTTPAPSGTDPAPPAAYKSFDGARLTKNALGAAAADKFSVLRKGMKPDRWSSVFCNDATGDLSTGYNDCKTDYYFSNAYSRLVAVYGKGNEGNLPVEARDVRFLFKQWIFSLVKYLQSADNASATMDMVHAGKIDGDNLFFDSIGSGQFEIAEYVDRHLVDSAGQDPTDITFTVDVLHGIFNDYTFSRDLYRGEGAIYSALLPHITTETSAPFANHPGALNNALLTNIFGSPVLAGAYADVPNGWSAYDCATKNADPQKAECNGQVAPLDSSGKILLNDNGRPVLEPYAGAFAGTTTPFRVGSTSKIKVLETYPFLENAKVEIPIHVNPFDLSSQALAPLVTMVPWAPKQAGIGFPVAVNGQQDKFVSTHQLDFSGTTISANVDFEYVTDPNTGTADGIKILGVETTDFLGEIFVCQDSNTGDLLRVRMYTSAGTIINWFTAHPGAADACGMIFRYSPVGNYLDYITSQNNGIRLGINPGAGGGRVVDVVLFDPTTIGQ